MRITFDNIGCTVSNELKYQKVDELTISNGKDLVAYSENGKKAVVVYDNMEIDRIYYIIGLTKENNLWQSIYFEKLENLDGIDAMSCANDFLERK